MNVVGVAAWLVVGERGKGRGRSSGCRGDQATAGLRVSNALRQPVRLPAVSHVNHRGGDGAGEVLAAVVVFVVE